MKREGKTHFLPKTSKGSTNYTSTCGLFMAPVNTKIKRTENLDEVTCSMCLKIINNKKRESIPGVAGILRLQKQFAQNKDWKNVQAINDTLKYIRDLETRLQVESNEDAVKAREVASKVKIPDLDAKIWYRLTQVITQQLGVKIEEIKPESSWVEDLGADSLDTVELVMALEEEFETEIPDEDAERMMCPLDAYQYVVKQVKVTS